MQKKQKIIIDTRALGSHTNHGIARYIYDYISHLKEIQSLQEENSIQIILVVSKDSLLKKILFPKTFELISLKYSWKSFLGQLEIWNLLRRFKGCLFHSLTFLTPLLWKGNELVTIHDMNHVVFAHQYSFFKNLYYKLLKLKLQFSSKVVTVSHFSKKEIQKLMSVNEKNISVIHNGLSSLFTNPPNIDPLFKQKYQLPKEFILCAGNEKPYKNIHTLIEAYHILKNNSSNPIPKLVVLSPSSIQMKNIIHQHSLENDVQFVQHVPIEDLLQFYMQCTFFVFPSLYEGFGFPPLEAMALGTLVLASNGSSLPEVLQSGALYFDPTNPSGIATCMHQALHLNEQEKEEKIELGISISKEYSWQRCAEKHWNMYTQQIQPRNFL